MRSVFSEDVPTNQSLETKVIKQEYLPSYGPVVKGGVDASVDVSYIYWRVSEDDLNIGSSGYNLTDQTSYNKLEPQGEQEGIFDRCSSGFKVGLGMDFSHDGWSLDVIYTWLHSNYNPLKECLKNPKITCERGFGTYYTIIPASFDTVASDLQLQQPTLFNNIASFNTALWTLRFNVIDVMLSKSFYLSPKFVLTPSVGLKTSWQNQSFLVRYLIEGRGENLGGASSIYNPTEEYYRIYNKQFYYGLGTRVGMDTSWWVSDSLSVFGQIYGTTLAGMFKDRREDVTQVTAQDTGASIIENNTKINLRGVDHFINTVLETQIGLRWDYFLCDEAYRLRLQFGYENQLWFNQNHFLTPYLQGATGADLGFMGFTATVNFDF